MTNKKATTRKKATTNAPAKKATPKAEAKKAPAPKSEPKQLSPDETKAKIAELLDKLKDTTIVSEKKAIRRQLRALGHGGGLGKKKGGK